MYRRIFTDTSDCIGQYWTYSYTDTELMIVYTNFNRQKVIVSVDTEDFESLKQYFNIEVSFNAMKRLYRL